MANRSHSLHRLDPYQDRFGVGLAFGVQLRYAPRYYIGCLSFIMGMSASMAQLRIPETPRFSSMEPVQVSNWKPMRTPQPRPIPEGQLSISERNAAIIAEALASDERATSPARTYNGPFLFAEHAVVVQDPMKPRFDAAYSVLSDMIDGKRPLDPVMAVFATDHTSVASGPTYREFSDMIDKLVGIVKYRLLAEGMDPEDPIAIHYGIQLLFTDTLVDPTTGHRLPPLRYDLEDFMGETTSEQLTVMKVLSTGEGQCWSMPLLYLLLADRMKAEAFWAFSPNHSYIKFRDANGTFHNFETTNGHITSDAWVMGSGFVKADAVKNRIYMDSVGTRKVIAHLLVDLAIEYEQRYGYDEEFMGACLHQALSAYPNDIHGWLALSNLRTAYFDLAAFRAGYPPLEELEQLAPALHQRLAELEQLYAHVDALGFAEMPPEAYAAWLRTLEDEKQKRTDERSKVPLVPLMQR